MITQNAWIQERADYLSAHLALKTKGFGILSGLGVKHVVGTAHLEVAPGAGVVQTPYNNEEHAVVVELPSPITGLSPVAITDGLEVIVLLETSISPKSAPNTYKDDVVISSTTGASIRVVPASTVLASNQLPLAGIRYDYRPRGDIAGLPPAGWGLYMNPADLPLEGAEVGDLVLCVSQDDVGTQFLAEYVFETISGDGYILDDLGIKRRTYWIDAETLAYDVWDEDSHAYTTFRIPTQPRQWKPTGYRLPIDSYADTLGLFVTVTDLRRSYVQTDRHHVSLKSKRSTPVNPHGIGFPDIGYDRMPVHAQVFDYGFGVLPATMHGNVGQRVTEYISGLDIGTDYFGNLTGNITSKYARPKHVPITVLSVVDADNGMSLAYNLVSGVVDLGTSFVGGDLSHYDTYDSSLDYAPGARVRIRYGANTATDVLYECVLGWEGAGFDEPIDLQFWVVIPRTSILVAYTYVPDLEFVGSDTRIAFNGTQDAAIVSSGFVLDNVPALVFDTSKYKNLIVPDMTLWLTSASRISSSVTVIDSAFVEQRTSSAGARLPVPAVAGQVFITAAQTPVSGFLPPCRGRLVLTSSDFYGRYKVFFTYGLTETTLYVNTTESNGSEDDINLDTAQLVKDGSYMPRDMWEYDPKTGKLVLNGAVFSDKAQYQIYRRACETPRNMRGVFEIIGTKPKPTGTPAQAVLEVADNVRVRTGDAVSVFISSTQQTVIKSCLAQADVTGFVKGMTRNQTATNIAEAFTADPVFKASGYKAVASGTQVVFTATAGQTSNGSSLNVSSPGNAFTWTAFEAGADHVPSLLDIVGAGLRIQDAQKPDIAAFYSVWSTGNLDAGASETKYSRVASRLVPSQHVGGAEIVVTEDDVAEAVAGTSDVLDTSTEFGASVLITGTDASGAVITETLFIGFSNFADIADYRVTNPFRYVYSMNRFASVTAWSVLEGTGLGSSQLFVGIESNPGLADGFEICQVNWSGSKVLGIYDARIWNSKRTVKERSDEVSGNLVSATLALATGW